MKVLQILDVRWDSGIMRYGLSLAQELKARGHAVRVWAVRGTAPFDAAEKLGLPVADCGRAWLRLARLRRDLAENPVEVVNAHSGAGHTLAAAVLLGMKPRPALVRTRGDARPLMRRPGGSLLAGRTQAFIAANEGIRREFKRLYANACPARTVYWGLDWDNPGPPEADSPLRIGMAARLDPVKGHAVLLKAFARVRAQVPGAELWLAGGEANIKAAEIRRRAAGLSLGESVHVLGRVGRMRNFYKHCRVGVVASTGSEAVSRAAVEWMASARPLVAASVGCLPEMVREGETGFLVPPGDPAALAERLLLLARDASRREGMGRAARRRFEARFHADRFVTETLEVYQDAIHRLPS